MCLLILARGKMLNGKQGWRRAQRAAQAELAHEHVHSSPGDFLQNRGERIVLNFVGVQNSLYHIILAVTLDVFDCKS